MKTGFSSHRNLSIPCRNTLVVSRIYKGATSKELEQEFNRTISTLMRTLRSQHYSDTETGRKAYNALKAQLYANDKKSASTPSIVPSHKAPSTPGLVPSHKTPSATRTVYLVETGTLLGMPINTMLDIGNGNEIFYVPRFCIDELQKMSRNDMRAKEALHNIYSDVNFKKRIFPLSNVPAEQSLLPRSPQISSCKRRSIGIVDSAVNLALGFEADKNVMVKVLTTSREVMNIMREVIQTENLEQVLSFAFVSSRQL